MSNKPRQTAGADIKQLKKIFENKDDRQTSPIQATNTTRVTKSERKRREKIKDLFTRKDSSIKNDQKELPKNNNNNLVGKEIDAIAERGSRLIHTKSDLTKQPEEIFTNNRRDTLSSNDKEVNETKSGLLCLNDGDVKVDSSNHKEANGKFLNDKENQALQATNLEKPNTHHHPPLPSLSINSWSEENLLVSLLNQATVEDPEDVLLTYRNITTPSVFLDHILKKYPILDDELNTTRIDENPRSSVNWLEERTILLNEIKRLQEENQRLRARLRAHQTTSYRLKIAQLLYRWVELHYSDFDEKMAKQLVIFIEDAVQNQSSDGEDVPSEILRKCLELLRTPPIPQDIVLNPQACYSSDSLTLLDFESEIIAEQHTKYESDVMFNIEPQELIKQIWSKKGKVGAPNIIASIEFFNERSCFFSKEIVKGETPKQRALLLDKIIQIGLDFYKLNNFNGVMEVLSCLHSSSISRLKQSWALLSPRNLENLDQLSKMMSPTSNYSSYRTLFRESKPPLIPFLGVVTNDFTFIDEANPDFLASGAINFEKLRLLAENLKDFLRLRSKHYLITPNLTVLKMLSIGSEVWTESEIYRLSQLRETTEESSSLLSSSVPSSSAQLKESSSSSLSLSVGNIEKEESNYFGSLRNKLTLTGRPAFSLSVSDHANLTKHDWKILLAGSVKAVYYVDDVILEEGDTRTCLYRIESGRVRVQTRTRDGGGVFHLEAPEMFGEVSLLIQRSPSTITAETEVELSVIEPGYIYSVFNARADLCKRFFIRLAMNLASHLQKMPTKKRPDTSTSPRPTNSTSTSTGLYSPQTPNASIRRKNKPKLSKKTSALDLTGETKDQKRKDEWYRKKFHLTTKEILMKEYPCTYKRDNKLLHSTLFISRNYVCYQSMMFGYKTKGVLPFKAMMNVEADPSTCELRFTTGVNKDVGGSIRKRFNPLRARSDSLMSQTNNSGTITNSAITAATSLSTDYTLQKDVRIFVMKSPKKCEKAFNLIDLLWKNSKTSLSEVSSGLLTPGEPLQLLSSRIPSVLDETVGTTSISPQTTLIVPQLPNPSPSTKLQFNLSKEEWDIILKGAKCFTYAKGQVVIREGTAYQRLYHIAYGRCRVVKRTVAGAGGSTLIPASESTTSSTDGPVGPFNQTLDTELELGKMDAGEVFGEINYLHGGVATATVIANEENTTVYVIDGSFMNMLFERKPGLVGRFFYYIARLLARRIKAREDAYLEDD